MAQPREHTERTVMAPPPSGMTAVMPPNRILSVLLTAKEDVEWTWTHTQEGLSYVSGYTIKQLEP